MGREGSGRYLVELLLYISRARAAGHAKHIVVVFLEDRSCPTSRCCLAPSRLPRRAGARRPNEVARGRQMTDVPDDVWKDRPGFAAKMFAACSKMPLACPPCDGVEGRWGGNWMPRAPATESSARRTPSAVNTRTTRHLFLQE